MIRSLYLLRHGHALPEDYATPDFHRPLSPRGVNDVHRVVTQVAPAFTESGFLAYSPARRTMETAEMVRAIAGLGRTSLVGLEDGYLADAWTWLKWLSQQADEQEWLGLVGHNPGLSELGTYLTGHALELPTSGWLEIEVSVPNWNQIARHTGRIRSFVAPKSRWIAC